MEGSFVPAWTAGTTSPVPNQQQYTNVLVADKVHTRVLQERVLTNVHGILYAADTDNGPKCLGAC